MTGTATAVRDAPRGRGAVLAAASALFAAHGYDATSMSDIADRLGVTKAALYRHVPGKTALLDAVTRGTRVALLALSAESAGPPGAPALERLGRLLRGVLELSETDPSGSALVWGPPAPRTGPDRSDPLADCREAVYVRVAGLLADARAEGALRSGPDPRWGARLLLGAVGSLAAGAARTAGPQDGPDLPAGRVVELLLSGLRPPRRSPSPPAPTRDRAPGRPARPVPPPSARRAPVPPRAAGATPGRC